MIERGDGNVGKGDRFGDRLGGRVGGRVLLPMAALFMVLLAACAEPVHRTPGPSQQGWSPQGGQSGQSQDQGQTSRPLYLAPYVEMWRPLLERLQADGMDQAQVADVADVLSRPEVGFNPEPMADKLESLYRSQFLAPLTKEIQRGLAQLGYDVGGADGLAGSQTRGAIREFQQLQGWEQDGEPTEELLAAVRHDLSLPPGARPVPTMDHGGRGTAPQYHESALRPEVVAKARDFLFNNYKVLRDVEMAYGVPPEIVTAILTVETRLGEYLGHDNAFVVLASMALARDLNVIEGYLWQRTFTQEERSFLASKAREKGDWAYTEFRALLAHARDHGRDLMSYPSSIYGAVGMCQFMPSNIARFGVDGDMDGDIDLFTVEDAAFSVGSYFHGHGWRPGLDTAGQRQVVMAYNHSAVYVNTVLELASRLR